MRDEDSTDKHLDQARRHMRRCNQTAGAAPLAEAIQPSYDALEAAQQAAKEATKAAENALDDLELAGRDGAEAVRNLLSAAAKEHDRKHPADRTHDALLEDGFSDLVHDDGTVEPTTLDRPGAKVKALGDGHALAARDGGGDGATTIRTADAAAKTPTEARALADANEEIAQAVLRRAYEANYLDGRKLFGRERVERLFPRARRRKKGGPPPT